MKVPAGSYLILSRPRSRSAWLAALLFGEVPCYHDELHQLSRWLDVGHPFGWAAPSMPMMDLDHIATLYAQAPIVVIQRRPEECYASLSRFLGLEFPPDNIARFEERFQALVDRLRSERLLTIQYSDLEQYETVNRIHEHCLGYPITEERFHVFSLLRIEQHLPKVIDNTPAAVFRRS